MFEDFSAQSVIGGNLGGKFHRASWREYPPAVQQVAPPGQSRSVGGDSTGRASDGGQRPVRYEQPVRHRVGQSVRTSPRSGQWRDRWFGVLHDHPVGAAGEQVATDRLVVAQAGDLLDQQTEQQVVGIGVVHHRGPGITRGISGIAQHLRCRTGCSYPTGRWPPSLARPVESPPTLRLWPGGATCCTAGGYSRRLARWNLPPRLPPITDWALKSSNIPGDRAAL